MSLATQMRRAAAGVSAGGFNPETSITWHSLFWAEGTAMSALGYSDTDAVPTWPNETGETDATSVVLPAAYNAANPDYNNQPTINFAGNDNYLSADLVSDTTLPLSVVLICNAGYGFDGWYAVGGEATIGTRSKKWYMYAGGILYSAVDNDTDPHLLVGHFTTGSSVMTVDGTEVISAVTTATPFQQIYLAGSGTKGLRGDMPFVGFYEGDVTADGSWSDFVTFAEDHYGLTIA